MPTFLTARLPALAAGLALIFGSFLVAAPAFAQSAAPAHGAFMNGRFGRPAVIGTVDSISGTTLTVTAKQLRAAPNASAATGTTYTVDAGGASVRKSGATISLSDIATGDLVVVEGTVSGSTVSATAVIDESGPHPVLQKAKEWKSSFTGNGEPVVGGSVTAVNGSTLTVSTTAGTTYTVDASGATVLKAGTSTPLSSIATGDSVVVQGSVNGSSVTASAVIDNSGAASGKGGVLGPLRGFFTKLFGFF